MQISKKILRGAYVAMFVFFAFAGYYAVLILLTNLGLLGISRNFTIPIRILILLCIAFIFIQNPRFKLTKPLFFFLLFSIFYYLRISVEFFDVSSEFHISETEFFLYYTSFVFFPVLFLSNTKLSQTDYKTLFYTIALSSIFMAVMTIYYYGSLLGDVSRISKVISRDENFISPLALSYSSVLIIVLGVIYLMTNTLSKINKIIVLVAILLNIVPFLLGASRGSVLALIIPFVIYFLFRKGIKNRIKGMFLGISSIFGLFILANFTGSGVFSRLLVLEQDFARGGGASERLDMWQRGFETFLNYPIFGNSLESEYYTHYPHNIIVESLISTGIIGTIPFMLTLYFCFFICIKILRESPNYYWICVIFIQGFTQGLFSGSIYAASWLAVGIGLLLSFSFTKKSIHHRFFAKKLIQKISL